MNKIDQMQHRQTLQRTAKLTGRELIVLKIYIGKHPYYVECYTPNDYDDKFYILNVADRKGHGLVEQTRQYFQENKQSELADALAVEKKRRIETRL